MKHNILQVLLLGLLSGLWSQVPSHELIYQSSSGVINPQVSPDMKIMTFTTSNYKGLYLLNLENNTVMEIASDPASGFGHSWSSDSRHIVYKPANFLLNRRYNSLVSYSLENRNYTFLVSDETFLPGKPRWQGNNHVYLQGNPNKILYGLSGSSLPNGVHFTVDKNRILNKTGDIYTIISTHEKEILDLVVSPDQSKLIIEEYGGDLLILDLSTMITINLGTGNTAEWSPDGRRIAFMITEDDGYSITSSNIIVVNSDGSDRMNVTENVSFISMNPTWYGNDFVMYDTYGNNAIYRVEVK